MAATEGVYERLLPSNGVVDGKVVIVEAWFVMTPPRGPN